MKRRYVFPAVFDYAEDGISVEFPDIPGCLTCGDTEEEALSMAREALALCLYGMEEDGEPIPEPTPAYKVKASEGQAVVLVDVWMPPFRDEMRERAVKKTLTIPKWLNDLAEANNVNFSRVLQTALKEYLGLQDNR